MTIHYVSDKQILVGKIGEVDLSLLNLTPASYVLDVGCARGFTVAELSKRGCKAYGIELLLPLVREAKHEVEATTGSGQALASSAMSLPFHNETFDAVICTEVIEHVPDADVVLSEICRVLKPHGRLCLSMPTWFTERLFYRLDANFATYSGHLRVFGSGEMPRLLECHSMPVFKKERHYVEWSLYWIFRTLFLKTDPVFYEDARKYRRLDAIYKRAWRLADRLWIGPIIKKLGNHIFPKSHYFYCSKV